MAQLIGLTFQWHSLHRRYLPRSIGRHFTHKREYLVCPIGHSRRRVHRNRQASEKFVNFHTFQPNSSEWLVTQVVRHTLATYFRKSRPSSHCPVEPRTNFKRFHIHSSLSPITNNESTSLSKSKVSYSHNGLASDSTSPSNAENAIVIRC